MSVQRISGRVVSGVRKSGGHPGFEMQVDGGGRVEVLTKEIAFPFRVVVGEELKLWVNWEREHTRTAWFHSA
jgi:hypothetical protein